MVRREEYTITGESKAMTNTYTKEKDWLIDRGITVAFQERRHKTTVEPPDDARCNCCGTSAVDHIFRDDRYPKVPDEVWCEECLAFYELMGDMMYWKHLLPAPAVEQIKARLLTEKASRGCCSSSRVAKIGDPLMERVYERIKRGGGVGAYEEELAVEGVVYRYGFDFGY